MSETATKTTFPKYPAYKDSGVDWLGEIPENWTLGKLGTLLKPVSIKGQPDLPLLSITRELGVIERNLDEDEGNHNFIPDDLSGYKVIREGQFGMNKMKAWQGSYGISRFTGIVSPAYYIFDFTSEIDPRFFHFAIRSKNYVAFFGRASDGVRIGQWDLSKRRMKEIPFFIPSPSEQTAIANFLDEKTAKIERAIAQKEQLIALLKERKQIVIQNAVTKGLDSNVKMKDSGVEWIGEIPEHWEVLPFTKYIVDKADYRGATPEKVDEGIYLLTAKNIGLGYLDYESSVEYVTQKGYLKIMQRGLPKIGDLLFTTEAPLGHFALVDREEVCLAQRIIRFRLNEKYLLSKFTLYSVISGYFQNQLITRGTGSTALGIKASKLSQLRIICPSVSEQKIIAFHIENQSAKIDQAISLQQTQIEKLKEYKASLIDSAVTGKIRVEGV